MRFEGLHYLDTHLSTVAHYLSKEQLFVVGGAVRDIILEINPAPHDIDLTSAGEPESIFSALQKAPTDAYSLFRTEKFGTVTLIAKKNESEDLGSLSSELGAVNYELTPFREEGAYADNRHPDEIRRSDSLLADAKRRDFTINCLYYTTVQVSDHTAKSIKHQKSGPLGYELGTLMETLSTQGRYYIAAQSLLIVQNHELIEQFFAKGNFQDERFHAWVKEQNLEIAGVLGFLVDPFSGLQDLEKGVLRCVGAPEKRFEEDALRILRGVRLVNMINQKLAQGNFDFEKETRSSMKKLHTLVPGLAKERLHQEIVKVFSGSNPFGWVALIDELGLLHTLFPALHMNKHDDQPVRYHPFDTYSHTLLTLRHLQQINDNYLVKLAMLYHDVGKKDQYAEYAKATTKEEMQEIHSSPMNHVISGPVFVQTDFSTLGFSNKEIEEIGFYVANHMRPGQILTAREDNQIKRMRQLLSENGYDRVKNLLDITVADRRGQFNPLQSREVDAVHSLYEMLEKLYRDEGQFTMHDLAIDGNDLMKEFSLQPGPHIKELLGKAFERVMADIAERNTYDSIITYLRSIDS